LVSANLIILLSAVLTIIRLLLFSYVELTEYKLFRGGRERPDSGIFTSSVKIDACMGDGVPHVTKLGPVLFLIMINDLEQQNQLEIR
jgi:hypothetical protein